MAPGFGHGFMELPGVQILLKANMSEQESALPPSRQGSGLRLKGREAHSQLEATGRGVFRKMLRLWEQL